MVDIQVLGVISSARHQDIAETHQEARPFQCQKALYLLHCLKKYVLNMILENYFINTIGYFVSLKHYQNHHGHSVSTSAI